jgi:hypothetical protein
MTILETIPGLDQQEIRTEHLRVGVHHRYDDGNAFVVLHGRAIVEFEDREALVYLRRGSMYRFTPCAETRWTVSQDLEVLPISESVVVRRSHEDAAPTVSAADADQAKAMRPFRPRRHVS